MNADDRDVVDITLRLTLRRGVWSNPDKWDWTDLLGLEGSEAAEVTDYEPVKRIHADGSVSWADEHQMMRRSDGRYTDEYGS